MKTDVIINRDALYALRELPSESVNCCVTSPPYYGLRDYGLDAQIGREDTPEQYIGRLVEVFRELRRVLKDDGTFWLNIADTYCGSGMKAGCKQKDLIGIPWLLAFALRSDGWYLRSDIQPKCPVVFEYPAQLPEHFHKPPDILLRRVLTSNLRVKPVVP
jgi:DNA modification methylase